VNPTHLKILTAIELLAFFAAAFGIYDFVQALIQADPARYLRAQIILWLSLPVGVGLWLYELYRKFLADKFKPK